MDCSVKIPYTARGMLGGIRNPKVPEHAKAPRESERSYPLFLYSGTADFPMATLVAASEPVTAPNIQHAQAVATTSPPFPPKQNSSYFKGLCPNPRCKGHTAHQYEHGQNRKRVRPKLIENVTSYQAKGGPRPYYICKPRHAGNGHGKGDRNTYEEQHQKQNDTRNPHC